MELYPQTHNDKPEDSNTKAVGLVDTTVLTDYAKESPWTLVC